MRFGIRVTLTWPSWMAIKAEPTTVLTSILAWMTARKILSFSGFCCWYFGIYPLYTMFHTICIGSLPGRGWFWLQPDTPRSCYFIHYWHLRTNYHDMCRFYSSLRVYVSLLLYCCGRSCFLLGFRQYHKWDTESRFSCMFGFGDTALCAAFMRKSILLNPMLWLETKVEYRYTSQVM